MAEEDDILDEEDFLEDDDIEDIEYSDKELNLDLFYLEGDTIIIVRDYESIRCGSQEQAKELYLNLKNRI